jgi:hypothetical protein
MEMTKKHWTIIGIVIGALAIYYFFIRKNKMSVESGYIKGGPAAPAPTPTEVCKYNSGETCRKGTPYCYCGTLEI